MSDNQQNQGSGSNTTTQQATKERQITVVSTRGEKKKINFSGEFWEELIPILKKEGYDLSNMKCVESVNKTTLEHPKARVPEADFNLFMMPYKSKSGTKVSRSDLYIKVKSFIEKDGEKAKEHFGNYTTKRTSDIETLVEKYKPGSSKDVARVKKEAIADVVESVKKSKVSSSEDNNDDDLYEEVKRLTPEDQMYLVIKLLTDIRENIFGKTESVVAAPAAPQKTQAEIDEEIRIAEEKKKEEENRRKEEEEDRKLKNEMDDLMGGFNDVDKRR